MNARTLQQRVQARDALVDAAEATSALLRDSGAIAGADQVERLAESLRQYQAELRAQAEELAESQGRTEQALARFSTWFNHLPAAALLLGPDGAVRECNEAARRLFALKPRGAGGRFLHRLVDGADFQLRVRPAVQETESVGAAFVEGVGFVAEGGARFRGDLHLSRLPAATAGVAADIAAVVIDRSEQLRTLQALHDSHARLAASEAQNRLSSLVAASTQHMVVVTDAKRRTVWANASFLHASGRSLGEVVGQSPGALVQGPGTDPALVRYMRERLDRGEGFSNVELLNYRKDGAPYWIVLDVQPVCGDDGSVSHFVAVQVDVTERRRAADALRASEAFLADSARLARIGGWDIDVGAGRWRWSAQMRSILGIDEAEAPGLEALLARARPAQADMLRAALRAAQHEGTPFDIEAEFATPGGAWLHARLVGHPDRVDGRVAHVSGVFQDISAMHDLHREIGDLTERLSMANEAGGIGIWDWDLVAGRVYLDSRMRGLIGPGLPALGDLGTALAPRLAPTDAELLHAAIEAALAQRTTLALELRLAGPVERYLHLTGRAQHDAGGQPVRMVGCAWDSTGEHAAARLLAAKEAAETASRAKSAFLSRMSHELRTPLNAILGFSQLMRMEAERGDLVLKPHRVDYIETAARHLLDLINEVLDVSRIEAGKMRVDDVELELPTLVSECLPLVQLQAEQAGVRLLNLIEPGGPLRAYGDRLRLKEVLINLLSNAVKYNRPGGSVGVSVQRRLDRIEIEVQDSGRGLSPEQRAQLFQPFNRVGAEATRIEGSGMGLFVSKRFVELMGGSLHVDSNPGVGSTFTVSLRPAR